MDLKHGTEEEHRGTLERAKADGIDYISSFDMRNSYLRENLVFGQNENIIELEDVTHYEAQESGWNIKWLED